MDFLLLGLAAATIGTLAGHEVFGFSTCAACLWLALNTILLSRLLEVVTMGGPRGTGWAILLGCAKIPASYAILYWLFQVDYLDSLGLTVGVLCLPVVLTLRGIAWRQHQVSEEGRQ